MDGMTVIFTPERGLGRGLVSLMISIARTGLPGYAAMPPYGNLGMAFVRVLRVIAGISSYLDIWRVLRIEPFGVFRG
jgi:putative ABC transport system permease protein